MPDLQKRAQCDALSLTSNNGLLTKLISEVDILSPIDGTILRRGIRGLWDTGASRSALDEQIIAALNLVSTGEVKVITANGTRVAKEYCVTIKLPNGVTFMQMPVTDGRIGSGIDMLIGMDVITRGDFSITNVGKTVLSFRIPSIEPVDFVQQANFARKATQGHRPKKK